MLAERPAPTVVSAVANSLLLHGFKGLCKAAGVASWTGHKVKKHLWGDDSCRVTVRTHSGLTATLEVVGFCAVCRDCGMHCPHGMMTFHLLCATSLSFGGCSIRCMHMQLDFSVACACLLHLLKLHSGCCQSCLPLVYAPHDQTKDKVYSRSCSSVAYAPHDQSKDKACSAALKTINTHAGYCSSCCSRGRVDLGNGNMLA